MITEDQIREINTQELKLITMAKQAYREVEACSKLPEAMKENIMRTLTKVMSIEPLKI